MATDKRRPTIDDVAARAGVSPAAVSFAVNGRPGVAEDTRRRILEAAGELGWHPSASARGQGVRVPGELSATGFDDSPIAALSVPPLTSVRVDYAGFGEGAAAALLAAIAGDPLPEFVPVPPALTVRGSTATAR